MPTPIWLTDEDSDLLGYKRAKIPFNPTQPTASTIVSTQPNRSDAASLVRVVVDSAAGPQTLPVTRQVGGRTWDLGWVTDPLNGPEIGIGEWVAHLWGAQSSALANVGLRVDVLRFTNQEATTIVSATSGALSVGNPRDVALTTGVGTQTDFDAGDRIVIRVLLVDAGGVMTTGYNATFSYNGLYGRAEGDSYLLCPDPIEVSSDIPNDDKLAVRTVLRDQGDMNPQLSDEEIVRAIRQAIQTYSVNRPRTVAYYYSGNGADYDYPLPPKWVWGFSRVVDVEYPTGQQIPYSLDTIDWELREGILGGQPTRSLRFRTNIPDSGTDNVLLLYTTRHEYSTEYSTIPVEDFDAVLWLAGSFAASWLASKGAGSSDSTINADVVNHRDTETRWGSVAKRLKDLYDKRVIMPDAATPVGSTVQWKPILSDGMNFLWHSRRNKRVR